MDLTALCRLPSTAADVPTDGTAAATPAPPPPSLDRNEINQVVVEMREITRGARFRVLRALGRSAVRYQKRFTANEADKSSNAARAQRLMEEAQLVRDWDVDRLSKALLAQERSLVQVGALPATGAAHEQRSELALARLAQVPAVRKHVDAFRDAHADWRQLVYFMLYKNTGGKFRKRDKKRLKKATPRCLADDLRGSLSSSAVPVSRGRERDVSHPLPRGSSEAVRAVEAAPLASIPQQEMAGLPRADKNIVVDTSSGSSSEDDEKVVADASSESSSEDDVPVPSLLTTRKVATSAAVRDSTSKDSDTSALHPTAQHDTRSVEDCTEALSVPLQDKEVQEDPQLSDESDEDEDFLMMEVEFNSPSDLVSYETRPHLSSATDLNDKASVVPNSPIVSKMSRKTRTVWNLWNILSDENDDSDREYGTKNRADGEWRKAYEDGNSYQESKRASSSYRGNRDAGDSSRGSYRGGGDSNRGSSRDGGDSYRGSSRGRGDSYRGSSRGRGDSYRGSSRGGGDAYRGSGRDGGDSYRGSSRGGGDSYRGSSRDGGDSYRGASRGRGDSYRGASRGGGDSYRGASRGGRTRGQTDEYDPMLHPSWVAKLKLSKSTKVASASGTRTTFNDDD